MMSHALPRSLHCKIHLSWGVCGPQGRVPGWVGCGQRNQILGWKEDKDPEELTYINKRCNHLFALSFTRVDAHTLSL